MINHIYIYRLVPRILLKNREVHAKVYFYFFKALEMTKIELMIIIKQKLWHRTSIWMACYVAFL